MGKKYIPEFYRSPFGQVEYTLVRNQKQLNKVLGRKDELFLNTGANAQVSFFDHPNGGSYAVVQMGDVEGRTNIEVLGLLVHEAMHVFQRILLIMNEHEPSSEFGAYSMQRISIDLFDMYERSNG